MNKNFKKIIATVAALAMASSSFVAMAATYPDVTPDAACYSAVEQLSALGIMEGFDDGTFKPEEKVTRAQMAKLVVGAKNLLAAAESNTTVKFDDVKADHWAVGYVAEGVAQQIINGTSDTTFDPDATVTFAQATKMLVNAAGYEEYAQIAGGWPNGYLTWGSTLGVNKGITGVGNETELTRAQVAQMLINAMKAPILKVAKYTVDNGVRVPEYKQMNGEDNKFESLLTNEWDTYEVYGRVSATSRSKATDVGEVKFDVEKSDNYKGNPVKGTTTYPTLTNQKMASGNSGAENYYLEYAYALINVNDDDEASIVYIESAGRNEYVAFNENLYVDDSYLVTATPATSMKLYKSETTTSDKIYELNNDVKLIVNGVAINSSALAQATAEAYLDGTNGSYENAYLIDSPQAGQPSTDGKYDYITLDLYKTAVVEEVITRANGNIKVVAGSHGFEVVADDEDTAWSFMLTDGTEIEVTDLQPKDVLSIQADPAWTSSNPSAFYNVIVSRDTAEGKLTGIGQDANGKKVYTIGDAEYKLAGGYAGPTLAMLTTYTLYLDKNGDVADAETLAASVNYAIVDRYFTSAGETKVRLIHKDGSKADYAIKADNTGLDARMDINEQYVLVDGSGAIFTADAAAVGTKGTPGYVPERIKTEDRFVEYSVNTSGEVTLNTTTVQLTAATDSYNERASRIGSYGVSDTSVILNAADFAKDTTKAVSVVDKGILVDEMAYTAAFLGTKGSDGTYPMVVMLTGNTGYTTSSPLQVATGVVKSITVDGTKVDAIPVFAADGTKTDLVLSSTAKITGDVAAGSNDPATPWDDTSLYERAMAAIKEGVAFVAATNSAGEVEEFTVVLSAANLANDAAMRAASTAAYNAAYSSAWTNKVKFVVAPVIKKYSSGIELAEDTVVETPTDLVFAATPDTGKMYSYAVDAVAYSFEGTVRDGSKVAKLDGVSEISQSVVTNSGRIPAGGTVIDWTSADNTPAYAVVRIYDNDVQEVYSIVLN